MSANTIKRNVAVFGSGPASAAVVLAILNKGLSVVWLRRAQGSSMAVGEHLAPDVQSALHGLKLNDILNPNHHLSCPGIVSYWGGSTASSVARGRSDITLISR